MKKIVLCRSILAILISVMILAPVVASESPGGGNPTIIPKTNTVLAPMSPTATGNILVIVYNYGYENEPDTENLEIVLTSLGYSVTSLYRPVAGEIAATLASADYDQVYLWDMTTTLGLSDAGDKDALVAWYSSHKGNIVIDARSYGLYYDVAKDGELIENIAKAFELRDGGLWIGTDHAESWAKNGNALLTAIGYGTVSGTFVSPIPSGDTGCELLTTPNAITPNAMWVESVGEAPTGVQSDNVDLKPLMWSDDVTYTSYALEPLGPPAPEFTTGAVALAILLTTPAFAYLLARKREN